MVYNGKCGQEERTVVRGQRAFGLAVAVLTLCAAVAFIGWDSARGQAPDEEPTGRYEAAVPDLILDTMTGKLTRRGGRVLEQPIDPAGTEVGRYSVDAYVTAVTRKVGLSIIEVPIAYTDLVKGYVIADTKTGQILRQKLYYAQPLQPDDL
jgi:hypothetical protein